MGVTLESCTRIVFNPAGDSNRRHFYGRWWHMVLWRTAVIHALFLCALAAQPSWGLTQLPASEVIPTLPLPQLRTQQPAARRGRRTVASHYVLVVNGTCASNGMYEIDSASECTNGAATASSGRWQTGGFIGASPDYPSRCFLNGWGDIVYNPVDTGQPCHDNATIRVSPTRFVSKSQGCICSTTRSVTYSVQPNTTCSSSGAFDIASLLGCEQAEMSSPAWSWGAIVAPNEAASLPAGCILYGNQLYYNAVRSGPQCGTNGAECICSDVPLRTLYPVVLAGTCASSGYDMIGDAQACYEAATTSGGLWSWQGQTADRFRAAGCMFYDNGVSYNRGSASQDCTAQEVCLCTTRAPSFFQCPYNGSAAHLVAADTSTVGTLHSSPQPAPLSTHCQWRIQAPPGLVVQLNFTQFAYTRIAPVRVGYQSLQYEWDTNVVRVFDVVANVSSQLWAPLSGSAGLNQVFESSESLLIIQLTSGDDMGLFAGFTATYTAVRASGHGGRCLTCPAENMVERAALMELFAATNGMHWKRSHGWRDASREHCSWLGVLCDGDGGSVVYLTLPDNRLKGQIPPTISRLTRLIHLNLNGNELSGAVPPLNMTSLELLFLGNNSLWGSIPATLYQLPNLRILGLSMNKLSGTLASEVGQLRSLQELSLVKNQLNGTIPSALSSLAMLGKIYLEENIFTGTIPLELGNMTILWELNLEGNRLSGPVPPELATAESLETLNLGQNRLSGTIPQDLANKASLQILKLGGNRFNGAIPDQWGARNIRTLNLSSNKLSGLIPPALGSLSVLVELDLSGNPLRRGSIPSELSQCIHLKVLKLSGTQLTGAIPSWLGDLSNLVDLNVGSNFFHGTIPGLLWRYPLLRYVNYSNNSFSGTIPSHVELPQLISLYASHTFLSGTIPPALLLSPLYLLDLSHNRLKGPVPSLRNSSILATVALASNALTGPLPELPGPLIFLDVGGNLMTGAVPESIGLQQKLVFLSLHSNRFTGPLPATLSRLEALKVLMLHNNRFVGQVPPLEAPGLLWVLLSGNSFEGVVPWSTLLREQLLVLSVARNQFSGELPNTEQLPKGLEMLLLDSNSFHGIMPDFSGLANLSTLSARDNHIKGSLHLSKAPKASTALRTVFVQNNRLSCPITSRYKYTKQLQSQNLVLIGNRFTAPAPGWVSAANVDTLLVPAIWEMWHLTYICAGLPALAICVFAVYKREMLQFFIFSPSKGLEQFELWCARTIMFASVPLLVVMLPLYIAGANFYQCGDGLLYTTIAYLSDSIVVEWCAAGCSCLATMMTPFLLVALCEQGERQFAQFRCEATALSWCRYMSLMGLWFLMLLVFSIPTALYAMSTTLPGDNIFNLNQSILNVSHALGGISLYLILTAVAPRAARWLITRVTGTAQPDPFLTLRLLQAARLAVGVVVPTAVIVALNHGCLGFWVHLWSPCANSPSSFDVTVDMHASGLSSNNTLVEGMFEYASHSKYPYVVSNHSDVCNPTYSADGQCPRAVLMALSDLIFTKCVLAAFVTPAVSMMRSLPIGMRILELLCRPFNKKDHDFVRFSLDKQLASISMFLEYLLILGLMVPLLFPLVAIALAMNCAVFHCAVEKLGLPVRETIRPCFQYLYLARGIGITFMIWFYMSNDLHGKWLVCFGMPICAGCGDLVAWHLQKAQQRSLPALRGLMVPLLGPDEWGDDATHDEPPGKLANDSESEPE